MARRLRRAPDAEEELRRPTRGGPENELQAAALVPLVALANPRMLSPANVVGLHGAVGNRTVSRLIAARSVADRDDECRRPATLLKVAPVGARDRLQREPPAEEERARSAAGERRITLPDGKIREEEWREHGPCDCRSCKVDRPAAERRKEDGPGTETDSTFGGFLGTLFGNTLNVEVGAIDYEFTNPGDKATDPFGSEDFNAAHKNAKSLLSWDTAKLDFTIALHCPWGVSGGDKTDVPSASHAVVTTATHSTGKPVYEQIAEDLTPVAADNWRPGRDYYWSRALTERHERFHSVEDEKWAKGPGTSVVKAYLNGKPVSASNAGAELTTLLENSMTEMSDANFAWYSGKGQPYIQRPGEKDAFLDGKGAYIALADAVMDRGMELEAEESEEEEPEEEEEEEE